MKRVVQSDRGARSSRLWRFALVGVVLIAGAARWSAAQEPERVATRLQFQFVRTPWEDVLRWLAASADLALQVNDLPTGSFTYADDRQYTPDEAINRVNLFLIPRGYSLVRSGRLLSVISLGDETSLRQLDAMAEVVAPQQLDSQSEQSLVKCFFPTEGVDPSVAILELSNLQLIRDPVILPNTRQIVVTDTAAKLKSVRSVLQRLAENSSSSGPIRRFPIGDADPELILSLVRPHVGLAVAAMNGPDVSLSVDLQGRQILASGSEQNLARIAAVIESLPTGPGEGADELHVFRTHPIGSADMDTVINVLETLLAGWNVRLTSDAKSNQVAVLGSDDAHQLVAQTIADLADTDAAEFKAIAIKWMDLHYAARVVDHLFNPRATSGDASAESPVQIGIDRMNNRLFVRARPQQMTQIERVLAELSRRSLDNEGGVRLLPYRGERGKQILESAERFWPQNEELLILPSLDERGGSPMEREVNPPAAAQGHPEARSHRAPAAIAPTTSDGLRSQPVEREQKRSVLTSLRASNGPQHERPPQADGRLVRPPIAVGNGARVLAQWTPRGILIFSEDADALNRFEEHLELIAGPASGPQRTLAVFYLKHATAEEASALLHRVLYAEADTSPSLISALPVSAGAADELGGGFDDASTLADLMSPENAFTIIPDARLNRLFVYASPNEIAEIEAHLEIIDREKSIAPVKTFGSPLVVALKNAPARQVAAVIRDAYAGRIAATDEERREAAQRAQRAQANGREGGDGPAAAPEQPDSAAHGPKMTLAVDEQSNSLIVTAPEQLASEVKTLALQIDAAGVQSIRIVPVRGVSSPAVYDALVNVFGERIRTPNNRSEPGRSPNGERDRR